MPVITAGRVTHPMEAEQIVSNEQADLVIMTRAIDYSKRRIIDFQTIA